MKRYTLISLSIGLVVALVMIALHFFGVYNGLEQWLDKFYANHQFYPIDTKSALSVKWLELVSIIVVSLWVSWCLCELIQGAQKLMVMIILMFVIGAISPTLALYGMFFSPFASLSAILLAASSAIVFAGTELGKRKRRLETVLGRRISKNSFNQLMASKNPPKFESAKREVSILTCRMYNRTELMEQLEPSEFLRMTNLFRRVTQHYLISQGAYIDESGPELIRAYFGLIQPSPQHANEAMNSALGLRKCLKSLNDESSNRWFQEVNAGIGISSGDVVSGIYGSKELFFLSGVGPQTDFSRRLAKVNKRYSSDIIIGPTTYKLIKDSAEVRPLEMFYDPDSDNLLEIYELISTTQEFSETDRSIRDHYWQGVIQFREEKYSDAMQSFTQAKVPGTEDGPLNFFTLATQEKLNIEQPEGEKSEPDLPAEGHSRLLSNL